MRFSVLAAASVVLAACSGDAGGGKQIDVASLSACEAVTALAAGMDDTPPFAKLVRDTVEGEFSGSGKATDAKPWGRQCSYGTVGGWNDGDPETHVFRCGIFDAGPSQFEEGKPEAEAAFEAARDTLKSCLGDTWTERENTLTQSGEEAISYIYERPADIERSETSDFYMYPIMLRKAFYRSPESRGGPWGWIVDVAFQQPETAAAD